MIESLTHILNRLYSRAEAHLFPVRHKERKEIDYWQSRLSEEGLLRNDHYLQTYTSPFDLKPSFYTGKRILDIGCGPRGSLEWADMATERVGLDPLVPAYLKLGADRHKMTYVAASSDAIPFAADYFDVVCSINSLDHVADVKKTEDEIKRVVRPGGAFLLVTEVNHEPTSTEPVNLPWSVADDFAEVFNLVAEKRFEIGNHDIHRQIFIDDRFDETNRVDRPGILLAKFIKK